MLLLVDNLVWNVVFRQILKRLSRLSAAVVVVNGIVHLDLLLKNSSSLLSFCPINMRQPLRHQCFREDSIYIAGFVLCAHILDQFVGLHHIVADLRAIQFYFAASMASLAAILQFYSYS